MNLTPDEEYAALKARFDDCYDTTLKPILQKSESLRHKYMLSFFVLLLLAAVFYPLIICHVWQSVWASQNAADAGILLGLSGFVIMLLCGPIYLYKRQAKAQVMPEFANFFGDFSYAYEKTIDDEIMRQSHLFKRYDLHIGDDYFSGVYDNVHIVIAENKLSVIQKLDTANGWSDARNQLGRTFGQNQQPQTRRKTVFQGICVLLEMNKNFAGQTVVLQDKGFLNAFYHIKGLERVRLEDSKFEKIFEVFSSDQIEARYLLTTAFMERMLKLRDLYGGRVMQFSFKDNKLLIAIQTKQNMFEANSFWCTNLNKKKIDLVFNQFWTVFSIIKILKLNLRLGM